jgi:hypothetical protein
MGRRSPKLKGMDKEVLALLKYARQQTGMTLLELEFKFTPRKSKDEVGANYGGRQWSRWLSGKIQPEIWVVHDVYNYTCRQLINGSWIENGSESEWAPLLQTWIEPKYLFLLEKRFTLLKILEQLEEPMLTENMLRGIEAGYYIPSEDEIRKIFWPEKYTKGGFEDILAKDKVEQYEMEALMTDILGNFGASEKNLNAIKYLANGWGFTGNDLASWGEQLHQKVKLESKLLNDLIIGLRYFYPRTLIWTDESVDSKNTFQFDELDIQLTKATRMFNDYVALIDSSSKASIMFGLHYRLWQDYQRNHFLSENTIGFSFPSVSIL